MSHHPLTIALPVDFTAFCETRHQLYWQYATLHLADHHVAEQAVQAALGDLAINWPHALRTARPAAIAWEALKHRIAQAPPRHPQTRDSTDSARDAVYALFPPEQADAVALHYLLGLATDEVAELIGADPAVLSSHLLAAQRRLGRALIQPPGDPRLRTPGL